VGKALQMEMLQKPFHEVETMIKKEREHDLSVSNMATLSAIKGKQFGHEIFSTVIKFKDLMDFLEVFPAVQRDVINRRVARIKNYVLSGLENHSRMRFFPAITVTARGHIFYNESNNQVAIDTQQSKLSINDGQHRFYGISEAIRDLQGRYNKAKDEETRKEISEYMNDLKNMVLPMVIFNNLTEAEEKQLFHDVNNLSQRPSRSANIRLVQTDYMAKIALEIATNNKYMKYYGVELNKMSIHKNNPNTILLTTIYAMIKLMYWKDYMADFNFINEKTFSMYKKRTETTFNNLFYVLPPDLNEKGKYILEKNYALRGIAKFIHHCRYETKVPEEKMFEAISKVDWKQDINKWALYGAFLSPTGKIQFGGNGEGGINAVFSACEDQLKYNGEKLV
jgi:DNA sulfur modification protein DndB